MTVSADHLRWQAEHEAELAEIRAEHPRTEEFLARLAALTLEFGIEITACCDLRLERNDRTVYEGMYLEDGIYKGRLPE